MKFYDRESEMHWPMHPPRANEVETVKKKCESFRGFSLFFRTFVGGKRIKIRI